jgi:hypothetical protein
MSTLTPEMFRALIDQIVTKRFFLTSEEEARYVERTEKHTTNIFPFTTTLNFQNFYSFCCFKAIYSTQMAP